MNYTSTRGQINPIPLGEIDDPYLCWPDSEPMTREEEREAFDLYRETGDPAIKEDIIIRNMRFVALIASRFDGQMTIGERMSEGVVGILEAFDRFQPEKGHKFITYAVWWIRQAIIEAIKENSSRCGYRIPSSRHQYRQEMNKTIPQLAQKYGRYPTEEELIDAMGWTKGQLELAQSASSISMSLDAPIESEKRRMEDSTLLSAIIASDDPAQDKDIDSDVHKEIVSELMEGLDDRDQRIIKNFFGFNGEEMNLVEIGRSEGVTRERIRQLRNKALEKMRSKADRLKIKL